MFTFPSHTVPKAHAVTNPAMCHTCTCDCVTCIPAGKVYSLHRPTTLSLLGKLGSPWPGVCCAGQSIITANSNWSPMTDSMATKDRGRLQRHWGKSIVSLVTCCHTESHTLDGRPLVVIILDQHHLCEPGALEHKTGCLYNPIFGMHVWCSPKPLMVLND